MGGGQGRLKNRTQRGEGWAQATGHAWASHFQSSGCFSHLTSKEGASRLKNLQETQILHVCDSFFISQSRKAISSQKQNAEHFLAARFEEGGDGLCYRRGTKW